MAGETASGYWYDDGARMRRGVRVLNAMRDYRTAEAGMRKRTRDSMQMGETDLAALRLLLQAQSDRRTVSPKDLARQLAISSASTTILVDRLEKRGHVERMPHPSDRRAIIVRPTSSSDTDVRRTLSDMHARMIDVAEGLDPQQADVVLGFLVAMRRAVEADD